MHLLSLDSVVAAGSLSTNKVPALMGIIVGNTVIEWPMGIGILDGYCLRETQDGLALGSEPEE